MLQVGIGHSTRLDAVQAAAEAASQAMQKCGAQRSELTLLFATPGHAERYGEMVRLVRELTRARSLVGCSGLGVLSTFGEVEATSGVAVMAISGDGMRATPFLVRGLGAGAREVGREIGRQVSQAPAPGSLLLLFPDSAGLDGAALFEGIREQAGHVPAIGGGAAGDPRHATTFQFCGTEVASDAVAGALLSGPFQASIEVTQACQPVGGPRVVTRAEHNRILEIDGRRALDLVVDLLGPLLRDGLERAGRFLFVGLPVVPEQREFGRGEYVVRPLAGIDVAAGALVLPQGVLQGQMVQILLREADGARHDLKSMLDVQARRHQGHAPRLGFYFNCCARGLSLYRIPEIDVNYIKYVFGDLPLIGFFGNAEIAPALGSNVLHQHTGVLALLSEAVS